MFINISFSYLKSMGNILVAECILSRHIVEELKKYYGTRLALPYALVLSAARRLVLLFHFSDDNIQGKPRLSKRRFLSINLRILPRLFATMPHLKCH